MAVVRTHHAIPGGACAFKRRHDAPEHGDPRQPTGTSQWVGNRHVPNDGAADQAARTMPTEP
jgi:hypothetical protein